MSAAYDKYLEEHISGVKKAYEWLKKHMPDEFEDIDSVKNWDISEHDKSKFSEEEYEAYDAYFYGNKTAKVMKEFDKAWLHHIHNNPHHWQYWILIEDDPKPTVEVPRGVSSGNYPTIINTNTFKCLEIPKHYILEMISDWWSFSWKTGNLFEIFDWYENHRGTIHMNQKSRDDVERILGKIRQELQKNASKFVIEDGVRIG